ncbi:MAG: long-chain-fatty-acid--CoA ligase [Desulfovibrionaceae bacterium]|jgi:fatty-acyl-CoA synthase|nr:long-chain-fatty-acid--CoA ligase [Desulfovibrionaceae bacterium]
MPSPLEQPQASRRAHWNNHLECHAAMRPGRAALRFNGATTTWLELHRRVQALADAFARRGVGFGDRVAIVMGNRPEFIETILAANLLGAIAVPLNFRLTGPEAAYILNDCGARLIVADEIGVPVVQAALPALAGDVEVVSAVAQAASAAQPAATASGKANCALYRDLLGETGAPHEPVDVPEQSPALIMYTSGTTGHPKGAVLCHINLQSQALTIIRTFQLSGDDEVNLVASPLFHIGAIGAVIPALLIGGTIVIMPTRPFNAAALLDLLENEAITTVFLVPTQWQAVCDDQTIGSRNLSALRVTCWGAAPATDTLLRQMAARFPGAHNTAVFGQTEMSPVTCALDGKDAIRKLGSVGKPVSTVAARIVDADMNDVAPGEVGEIVYRGSGLMLGYWNNPEATAQAFRGGWFHSGDLVRADSEGYLYVVDRVKDMIISGGENIYCAEVENALAAHPAIAEVSVVGRPHPVWGETPVAYASLRDPAANLSIDELRDWASDHLAKYKLPTQLHTVAALPRSAAGKVLKNVLREQR